MPILMLRAEIKICMEKWGLTMNCFKQTISLLGTGDLCDSKTDKPSYTPMNILNYTEIHTNTKIWREGLHAHSYN